MDQIQPGSGNRIQLQIMGDNGEITVYQEDRLAEGLTQIAASRGSFTGHGTLVVEGQKYAFRVEPTYGIPYWLGESGPGLIEKKLETNSEPS